MSKGHYKPSALDRARDELFSHIQRCGVLEADADQRLEWLDDTTEYLAERYPQLSKEDLGSLKTMGERYCSPAIPHGNSEKGDDARDGEADEEPGREITDAEPTEASAA